MADELRRRCTDCAQVDGHPRHTLVFVDPSNPSGVSEAGHHFDCGSNRTEPCTHCVDQLKGWNGGVGDEMSKHLMAKAEEAA